MSDYRINSHEIADMKAKIQEGKKDLEASMGKVKNHYEKISRKSFSHHQVFKQAFLSRCGYCGVPSWVINSDNFEVDHIIPQSLFGDCNRCHHVSNLAYACHFCNSKKRGFNIGNYRKELGADEDICNTFVRDDSFRIIVSNSFRGDVVVEEFYKKLQLGEDRPRLDYLLGEMKGFIANFPKDYPLEIKEKLLEIFIKLRDLRNE